MEQINPDDLANLSEYPVSRFSTARKQSQDILPQLSEVFCRLLACVVARRVDIVRSGSSLPPLPFFFFLFLFFFFFSPQTPVSGPIMGDFP